MKHKMGAVFAFGIILTLIVSIGVAAVLSNMDNSPQTFNPQTEPTPTPTASPTPQPTTAPITDVFSHPLRIRHFPNPLLDWLFFEELNLSPSATPTPSPKPTPTPTASPTPPPTPSPTPTPSPSPTPNPDAIRFTDNFQSGTTDPWTNTQSVGVNLVIKNGMLECSTPYATEGNWGYVYKVLDQTYPTLYWRWYIYFSELPATDGNIIGCGGIYNSAIESNYTPANAACSLNVVNIGGDCYWNMVYVNNDVLYSLNSTITIQPGTWYLVELKAVQGSGNGEAHFYLNNVETLTATGLTNNHNIGLNHVSIGGGITADRAISWYYASAVASTEYVGPKT